MEAYLRYKRVPVSKLQSIAKSYRISVNTEQKFVSKARKGQYKPKTRKQLIDETLKKKGGKKRLEDALYQKRGEERPRSTCPPYRGKKGSRAGGVQGYSSFNAEITKLYGSKVTITQRRHIWAHCRDKKLNKTQLKKYIETYLREKPSKSKTNAEMKRDIKKALDGSVAKSDLQKIGQILKLEF